MTDTGSPPYLRENVPLGPFTTLGVGGAARFLAEADCESAVHEALAFAAKRACPIFVLGGGSNILVSDQGFPGLVLHIAVRGIRSADAGSHDVLTVGAGEDWDFFVQRCIDLNLAGVECLSGIPGTVGGTPVQNVGAYGEEVSDSIVSVRVLDRESQAMEEFSNQQCGFAYRSSIFNTTQHDRYIILSVTFSLQSGGAPKLVYDDLRRLFKDRPHVPPLWEVRDAVLAIRRNKGMLLTPGDPDCRSAGSFFKNPIVSDEAAYRVEATAHRLGKLRPHEVVPRFKTPAGEVKLPAAWLIERAGFHKGFSRGPVGVSTKHTLAIINRGGAAARDIVELMREIQEAVRNIFGIDLVPEPVFVGF